MLASRRVAALALLALVTSCSESPTDGAVASFENARGESGNGTFSLVRLTSGNEQLLPHRALEIDGAGRPTGEVVDLRSVDEIATRVSATNPLLPTPTLSVTPRRNHAFVVELSDAIDPSSVFDLSGSTPVRTDALRVTAFDSDSQTTRDLPVRVLVGGVTAITDPAGARLERWAAQGAGLPGQITDVAAPNTILIVADADGDLSTRETFPIGVQIGVELTASLRATGGAALEDPAFVATTVGDDTVPPHVAPGPLAGITPVNGAVDVDPATEITVRFTETVQPYSVGPAFVPDVSGGVSLEYGPPTSRSRMPFVARPRSAYDLASYVLTPASAFPGSTPGGPSDTGFNQIDVTVPSGGVIAASTSGTSIPNQTDATFGIGVGPGLANVPVTPDAIYLGRSEAAGPSLSVVDLNGFGGSTGNPVTGSVFPGEGETRFPWNPNVRFNSMVWPPLGAGTSTVGGGSAGVFTLTLDTGLQPRLVTGAQVAGIDDMHIGHPLDTTFRNAPPPFGCQSGGGNICALDGLKLIVRAGGPGGSIVPGPSQFGQLQAGYGNLVSWAPHPNPPQLTFPPLCVVPEIASFEPTSVDSAPNLLVPGNPFADPAAMLPPTGLLARWQNAFFQGPTFGQTQVQNCAPYMIRNQIGHFLYVADRARDEVVVLHSNRMRVIDRISVPDATDIAMDPNLGHIAVTSPATDQVFFIDVDPASAVFHQVTVVTQVGDTPRGVAWQPSGEDIIVCNEGDGTLSIVSGLSLNVRKTVSVGGLTPFDVAAAPRQTMFSFRRNVYFAYVLTREGVVAVFESGPDGINGWGYDDVVGTLPYRFLEPRAIQPSLRISGAGVLVAHEAPLDPVTGLPGAPGDGAVTEVEIESGTVGTLPLVAGMPPQIRDLQYGIAYSLAESAGQLSGVPVDLAFDDLTNRGATPGFSTVFSAGSPLPANSKTIARSFQGLFERANVPDYLFVAVPEAGVVDVVAITRAGQPRQDVNSYASGTQSIPAPGTNVLASYWRQ